MEWEKAPFEESSKLTLGVDDLVQGRNSQLRVV